MSASYPRRGGAPLRGSANMTYFPPNRSLVNSDSHSRPSTTEQPAHKPILRGPTIPTRATFHRGAPNLSYRATTHHSLRLNTPIVTTPDARHATTKMQTASVMQTVVANPAPITPVPILRGPSPVVLRSIGANQSAAPVGTPYARPPILRGGPAVKRGTRTYRRLESLNYVRDPTKEAEDEEKDAERKRRLEREKEKIRQKKLLLEISKVAGIINRYKVKRAKREAKLARKRGRDGNMHYFNGSYLNAKRLAVAAASSSASHKTLVSKHGYVPNKIVINGVTYTKSADGKSLKRTSVGSSSLKRNLVLRNTSLRSKKKKKNQYCLFYNRFGRCNKGEGCPYIHDPEKVAVCRKFLKGECDDPKCLLQHKVDKNKMPVCTHYLRGICSRDPCPYLHVNVSNEAAICEAFLKGYCPDGENCKLRHVYPKKEKKKRKRTEKDEDSGEDQSEGEGQNAELDDSQDVDKPQKSKKRLRLSQQLKLMGAKNRVKRRSTSLIDSGDSSTPLSESNETENKSISIKPNFLVMNREREAENTEEVEKADV